MTRALAPLALLALLGGCGFKPLYAGGSAGQVALALGRIEVAPIEGKAGWLVANALRDRLGTTPAGGVARYRLQIKLQDEITGLAIRRDDSVARERRTLRARYQLVEVATGGVMLDATAGSDAGIDVVGSEYATIAAESTSLERLSDIVADQILMRVAVHVGRMPPTP